MSSVLAIDAGQTGIKVRLRAGDRTLERTYPGVLTHQPVLPQIAAVAEDVAVVSGTTIDVLAAGVSGLTDVDADPRALMALLGPARPRRAILAHDSTTSFLGALGDRPGAVVAAGTGVVTLAVGPRSVARVDGWGNIMGDSGSGYWIGRHALEAVMRTFDGRGPETALTELVQEVWPELPQAYISLQGADNRVSIVASFARAVADTAAADDPVALSITRRAADELALSVATALDRVEISQEATDVAAIGGVFRSAALHEAFERALAERAPAARIVEPDGHGIDGVVRLATLPESHPLRSSVWLAAV